MRRFFNVRLEGLFEDPPTADPQEILWFYEQLPDNAATRRSPSGETGHWEIPTLLGAMQVNATQTNTYAFVSAHSKKAPKAPQPILPPAMQSKPSARRIPENARVIDIEKIPDIGSPTKE
jgi:hypothetical protein